MKTTMKWMSAIGLACAVMNCAALDFGDLEKKLKTELPVNPRVVEAVKDIKGPDESEEIAIGRQIAGDLLGAAPLVKDARLQKYVNQVGEWVASQSERPDLPWHFGVIQSEDVNAFAAPGGYIFVTLGLYRLLQNEADLAGVLGHEIGHVIRKHHLKLLQPGIDQTGWRQRQGAAIDRQRRGDRCPLFGQGCRVRGGPHRRGAGDACR